MLVQLLVRCSPALRPVVLAGLAAVLTAPLVAAADPPAPVARAPVVPPVPAGTPAELLAYIEQLADPEAMPKSRGRQRYYLRKAAAATVEAADRILADTKPGDAIHGRAVAVKFDALRTQQELGEPGAAARLAAFADTIDEIADPAVATAVRRVATEAEVAAVIEGGRPDHAAPLVARLAAQLRESPNDADLAETATLLAGRLARMPGGEPAATAAFAAFLPVLESSGNPAVRGLAAGLAGTARRLALPGNPMRITGTLLSGEPFDQATLAGKVVLVDFWATWCGPCVAEIGNLREQYAKWHDRGFEVVGISLDEDRDALERFVAEKKLPWPVLFEEPGGAEWNHPLADYYGITGIPTVVLIGRDGNVVTLDARGPKLAAALERLLGEPAARLGDRRP